MVYLSKIYTRSGDGGKTRLVGGTEVSKASLKIESYGTIDELNSVMGLARTTAMQPGTPAEIRGESDTTWESIQQHLFDIGSILATEPINPGEARPAWMPVIRDEQITALETRIDVMNELLGPLKSFVLPGGNMLNAYLHLGRTVARRAERVCVALAAEEAVEANVIKYVYRLSDYLFVASRWVSKIAGDAEFLWKPGVSDAPK
jgi:cob(I)alamin adenosyltransferase